MTYLVIDVSEQQLVEDVHPLVLLSGRVCSKVVRPILGADVKDIFVSFQRSAGRHSETTGQGNDT